MFIHLFVNEDLQIDLYLVNKKINFCIAIIKKNWKWIRSQVHPRLNDSNFLIVISWSNMDSDLERDHFVSESNL